MYSLLAIAQSPRRSERTVGRGAFGMMQAKHVIPANACDPQEVPG